MYFTAQGEVLIYKDGETWRGGFSVCSTGLMVYMLDSEVMEKYKPQHGSLAAGNAACLPNKPTRARDATALQALLTQMITEAAAKCK